MEALSERYGWLPSQIREERSEDIRAYLTIIAARQRLEKHKLWQKENYR